MKCGGRAEEGRGTVPLASACADVDMDVDVDVNVCDVM